MPRSYRNGEVCPADGSYYCDSHSHSVQVKAGDPFPNCKSMGHSEGTIWLDYDPDYVPPKPEPPPPPPPIPESKMESFFGDVTIDGVKKKIKIRPFRRLTNKHLIPSQYTISVRNAYFDDLYQTSNGWQLKHRVRNKKLADEIGKIILAWFQ